MTKDQQTTLRLVMPQWQGSDNPIHSLGASLLGWLASDSDDPLVEVPAAPFQPDAPLDAGFAGAGPLMARLQQARQTIDEHAPFAYLSEGYDG